jgi:hypothetical protein
VWSVEEKNLGGGGISLSCPKRACIQTSGRLRYLEEVLENLAVRRLTLEIRNFRMTNTSGQEVSQLDTY